MRSLCILLLLVTSSVVFAQPYVSRLGRFRMDEIKGCAPLTVSILDANLITVGQCTFGAPCDMAWGDGAPGGQNLFTHTYTQPGTYVLTVVYQSLLPRVDDITITVTANNPPAFDIYLCSADQVQVKVTDTNYDAYIINYNDASPEVIVPKGTLAVNNHSYTAGAHTIDVRGKDASADDNCVSNSQPITTTNTLPTSFINQLTVAGGSQIDLNYTNSNNILYRLEIAANTIVPGSFQTIQTFHDITTTSISNSTIQTDNNYYCFRTGSLDACTNSVTTYSNIICSANFDVTPQDDLNDLDWATSTAGVTNFSVNRDGASIGSTAALTFPDNNVGCKTNYCYQLFTNYANGSQSISIQKCATAFSTDAPTPIVDVTAAVGNNGVDLTWQQDPAFQTTSYSVFRKSGANSFSLLSTTPTTQFTDATYSTGGEFCYRINYTDNCDNASPAGIDVCPIRLSGTANNDNTVTLNWTAYQGWTNGVSNYTVEKFDDQGAPLQTFPVGTSTTFDDLTTDPAVQQYIYIITADANDLGLGQAVSNEIILTKAPHLYYPKAFTPNGDNLNDVFTVFAQFVAEFEMKIFNRWGELLFTTKDLEQGWDGTYKGTVQPEGTYTFVANITDLAGRTFKRSGSVVLLDKK